MQDKISKRVIEIPTQLKQKNEWELQIRLIHVLDCVYV
jgi:hypothetical protein